ncbi:type II secretion system protein N [Pantoea dispersa]|uniref:type II secretion system protein N n=1 Tax=Pantoea dispersa TaxID=59814 RepID=UPI0039B69409
MQRLTLLQFRLPASLPTITSYTFSCVLFITAFIWLSMVLSAPKPALPPLPHVAPRITTEPHVLPDLFPHDIAEDAFAISRLNADDPRLLNAPLSRLPFSVTGILNSSNPQKSLAILTAGTQQFLVSVNDTLQGSTARVVRIFADRLILAHQDRYETLLMSSDNQKNRL